MNSKLGRFLECQKHYIRNICDMCGWDLPDMYTQALGRVPKGECIHIRQIPPAHVM